MLAGRKSFIGETNWFRNHELISFGLDVNRPHSGLPAGAVPAEQRLLQNRTSDADFSDFHGKALFQLSAKTRVQLAGYAGSDRAIETADRYFQVSTSPLFNLRFRLFPVSTESRWTNESWSATVTHAAGDRTVFSLQTGGSFYRSRFFKGDFAYPPRTVPGNPQPGLAGTVIDTFANRNQVSEFKINPQWDVLLADGATLSAGAAWYAYDVAYREENVQRPNQVLLDRRSNQFDAYVQFDKRFGSDIMLQSGLRVHYFSAGDKIKVSPRVAIEKTTPFGTLKTGYTRSYQFLHRFNINQQIPADVWSLTSADEPVTEAGHLFAGWKTALLQGATFSAEGYLKNTRNMRLHEISSVLLTQTALGSPRFYGNDATSRGLEMLFDQRFGNNRAALTYTLARTQIKNSLVNGGAPYDAEWDRRHQISGRVESDIIPQLKLFAIWNSTSGAPNYLARFSSSLPPNQRLSGEPDRLGWYHRLDAGASFRQNFGPASIEASFSVFNVFNRMNPWYRSVIQVLETDRFGRQNPKFYPVDVYDLGIRPAFEIRLLF
jgi:hypothetical protein